MDYSNKNLRGKSFRDQDLTGANFSGADISGANFSTSILVQADFRNARAGRRYHWIITSVFILLMLGFLAGYLLAYCGALIGSLMVKTDAQPAGFWSGSIALVLLLLFCLVTVKKGLGTATGIFSIAVALIVVTAAAVGDADSIAAAIVQAVAIAGLISGVFLCAILFSLAWTLSRYVFYPLLILILLSYIPGAREGVEGLSVSDSQMALALTISGIVALVSATLSLYISRRIIKGDENYFLIPAITIWIASLGGTCFRGANLTDADFTQANVKSSDFRQAILKRTCWFQSAHLQQCRLKGTYLENPQIRRLVTLKNAPEQTYDYLDLRGLNLEDVNLKRASLIGTDFNESNLKNANLAGAKLVKAQLYQTDLAGAILTGAYIQDWGISTQTNLNKVKCEYIYMRLPGEHDDPDPSRKPDNKQENFQEGDFADFIAPIIKTLGLYQTQNIDPRKFKTLDLFHHEGIDPGAAAVTIQKVAEKYPDANLEVIALEGRGSEKIRLQAKVSDNANRSELSQEYFAQYEKVKALSYDDIQKLLIGFNEKDNQIRSLEQLLKNALKQPKFYVETYQNQGEFIMTQENKGNIKIGDVRGHVSGVVAAGGDQTMTGVAIGAISGKVTNTISQLPASPDLNELGLRELLTQLQAAIEAESELPDEDKAEALEQVNVLAEAGKSPEDTFLQKASKTAMKILKGTISSLPDAAKLVESGVKLLPIIAALLAH